MSRMDRPKFYRLQRDAPVVGLAVYFTGAVVDRFYRSIYNNVALYRDLLHVPLLSGRQS